MMPGAFLTSTSSTNVWSSGNEILDPLAAFPIAEGSGPHSSVYHYGRYKGLTVTHTVLGSPLVKVEGSRNNLLETELQMILAAANGKKNTWSFLYFWNPGRKDLAGRCAARAEVLRLTRTAYSDACETYKQGFVYQNLEWTGVTERISTEWKRVDDLFEATIQRLEALSEEAKRPKL